MSPEARGGENHQRYVGQEHRPVNFINRDRLGVRDAGEHQWRARIYLKGAVAEAVQVEQEISRQRMPERHAPEHHEDDRDDDDDVEEEVWEEGIQCNESMEGSRAGGREEELEAVQRCKSERSSCAKVQRCF